MRTPFSPSFSGFMMTQRTVLVVMFLAVIGLFATTLTQAAEFPKVGHYTSSAWGFSTNSFWLEGPTGVVLVDTQFLPSATEELLQVAERYTGKKVLRAELLVHRNRTFMVFIQGCCVSVRGYRINPRFGHQARRPA
jgi:hypothetical protein